MGGNIYSYSVATDANGNVYTHGTFLNTVDFDPGPGTFNLTNITSGSMFVQKLDSVGNFVWAVAVGGTSGPSSVQGNSIAIDTLGTLYIPGIFSFVVDFNLSAAIFNMSTSVSGDVFILKLDSNGNFIWAKSFGGNDAFGNSIAIDKYGAVYTAGSFTYTADFDPGAGVTNLAPFGGNDSFIQKLDINGNFVWAKSIGISRTYSLAIDSTLNIYTCGRFSGTPDFDPGPGTFNITAYSPPSVFELKLSQCLPNSSTDSLVACQSVTWIDGNIYTTSNNTAMYTLTNQGGCDSVVTLSLNILPSLTGSLTNTICNDDSVIVNGTTYNVANPTGTEVFTNVGPNNCDSTVTINLTVLPALTGSVTTTICNEESIVINGTTYNATNPSGTEIFTGIGLNSCDSSVAINLMILPAIDTSTTTNGFVITSNQAGASYQWLDCTNGYAPIAGETNATYTATANGDYAVVITINGCTDTSACVNISTVGINNVELRMHNVELYPNPANENITISNSKSSITAISIINITGKEVYSLENVNETQTVISLTNFSKGIYFVKVQSGHEQKVLKLIKQ